MSKVRRIRTARTPNILIRFRFDIKDYAYQYARADLMLHTANVNVIMREISKAVNKLAPYYTWRIADVVYDEAALEYDIKVII